MYLGLDEKSRAIKKHLIEHHAKYLGCYTHSVDGFGGNFDYLYKCKRRYYVINVTDDYYESWQNYVREISKAEARNYRRHWCFTSNEYNSNHCLFNEEYEIYSPYPPSEEVA